MNGGSRIIDIRPGKADSPSEDRPDMAAPSPAPPMPAPAIEEPGIPQRRFGWVVPLLAAIACAGWLGAMIVLAFPYLPQLDPVSLAGFIAALCVPPALIGVLLLLALRTGTAEARRFGRTAAAMRAEAAALEATVARLGQAIDANRHTLADQATMLMTIGDGAVTRLGTIGSGIAEQMQLADANGARLADAAKGAQATLDTLLTLLPRAHADTTAMTALLDQTGTTAGERATALDDLKGAVELVQRRP